MEGDLEAARGHLPELLQGDNPAQALLAVRIASILERADALAQGSALDADDLRGWHFVLHGALLLHLSAEGREVMRGRYAFVQDSHAQIREGLARLQLVLPFLGKPEQILALSDRGSRIVAEAAGAVLGLPVQTYSVDQPGLIVAYDLAAVAHEELQQVALHRAGQVLFTHAASWTEPVGIVPDVATFLYQSNTAPWEEQLRVGPDEQVVRDPADASPIESIAARIASLVAPAISDQAALLQLVAQHGGAWERKSGPREPFFYQGPVKSNRFR